MTAHTTPTSDPTTSDPTASDPTASDPAARTTEQLDEALACVRKYGRQNAADTRALETAIRSLRSRIANRVRELAQA